MIWKLTREQLRSQRNYVAWTAALLTLTVAVATFGAFSVTTQQSTDHIGAAFAGHGGPWQFGISSAGLDGDAALSITPLAAVEDAIATATANGSDLVASRYLAFGLETDNFGPFELQALTGDVEWDRILASGTPPATGQVVVPAQYAQENGLVIGDDARLRTYVNDTVVELEISGLTNSPVFDAPFTALAPHGFVAWEDSASLALELNPDSAQASQLFTQLSWNEGDPALDALATADTGGAFYSEGAFGSTSGSWTTGYTVVIGLALLLGLVAMAFAVGRSQAQARLKWVATARTLGATRSTIAAATMLETVLVGVVASAIGFVLGYAAAAAALAASRATVLEPALPEQLADPWLVLSGALLLGVVLSIIIGAIPAFWASRISPVAALKPVNDVTEAEVSRRVNSRAIYVAWGAVIIMLAAIRGMGSDGAMSVSLGILLMIAAVALGIAVVMDALRHIMTWLGGRLSAQRQPWAIAAGDALSARPRQAAIPSFIMTALIAGVVTVVTYTYYLSYTQRVSISQGEASFGWFAYVPNGTNTFARILGVTVAGLLVVTLTTLAIAGSAQRAVGADAATREALGLTPGAARIAAGLQYGVPLAIGVVVGWVLGLFLASWFITGGVDHLFGYPHTPNDELRAWFSTSIPVTVIVVCGFVTAALVGGIVALTTRTGAPVKQLQRTS